LFDTKSYLNLAVGGVQQKHSWDRIDLRHIYGTQKYDRELLRQTST